MNSTDFSVNLSGLPVGFSKQRLTYLNVDVGFHRFFNLYFTSLVLIIGLVANILIIIVMNRSSFKRLPLSVYFTSLAVSDILVLGVGCFEQIFKQSTGTTVYQYTSLCSTIGYLIAASTTTSNWLIVCIACERLLVIIVPLKAKVLTSKGKATAAVTSVTLIIFLSCTSTLFLMDYSKPNCKVHLQYLSYYIGARLWMAVFGLYMVPLIIISLAYITLIILVNKKSSVVPHTQSGDIRQKRLTITSMYICLSYMLLTTPHAVYVMLTRKYDWLYNPTRATLIYNTLAHCIRLLNYSTNLFIYMATNTQFRQATVKLFKKGQIQTPGQSSTAGIVQ